MILVVDSFAENFEAVLEESKKATYAEVVYNGNKYPGLSPRISPWAYPIFEKHLGFKVVPVFDYIRIYEKGIEQPSFIHSDETISKYTAVLSLREKNGSLAFWKNLVTDKIYSSKGDPFVDGKDESKWEQSEEYELRPNRCIIYDASFFHSRIPREWTENDPRHVHVFFFNPDPVES